MGSLAPNAGRLGMLAFLRPGAFKGKAGTLAGLQIPGQTASYKPVHAG